MTTAHLQLRLRSRADSSISTPKAGQRPVQAAGPTRPRPPPHRNEKKNLEHRLFSSLLNMATWVCRSAAEKPRAQQWSTHGREHPWSGAPIECAAMARGVRGGTESRRQNLARGAASILRLVGGSFAVCSQEAAAAALGRPSMEMPRAQTLNGVCETWPVKQTTLRHGSSAVVVVVDISAHVLPWYETNDLRGFHNRPAYAAPRRRSSRVPPAPDRLRSAPLPPHPSPVAVCWPTTASLCPDFRRLGLASPRRHTEHHALSWLGQPRKSRMAYERFGPLRLLVQHGDHRSPLRTTIVPPLPQSLCNFALARCPKRRPPVSIVAVSVPGCSPRRGS